MSDPRPRVSRRAALQAGAAVALAPAALGQPPARPEPFFLDGYTDRLSYAAGDEVKLHAAAQGNGLGVTISRAGPKPEVVWQDGNVRAPLQPVPPVASSHGCRWPAVTAIKVPDTWRSGYYRVTMTATAPDRVAHGREAFFVVRPKEPGQQTRILLPLATNTYNAYTNWGGYSLYAYNGRHKVQGRRVSFDRPLGSQFRQWEEPFANRAEANGYVLDRLGK